MPGVLHKCQYNFRELAPVNRCIVLHRSCDMAHEVRPRHLSTNDVEGVLEEMHSEKDPLAVHILVSRRSYRNVRDTKSGKKRETFARRSWRSARELGFRGNLEEWERLMGAVLPGERGRIADSPLPRGVLGCATRGNPTGDKLARTPERSNSRRLS